MLCVVLRSWYEYSVKHQSETVWLLACMVGKMISISMAHLYCKLGLAWELMKVHGLKRLEDRFSESSPTAQKLSTSTY